MCDPKEDVTKMVVKTLDTITKEERENFLSKLRHDYLKNPSSIEVYAYDTGVVEGIKESYYTGMVEGYESGVKDGYYIGVRDGVVKGNELALNKVAKKMIRQNYEKDIIKSITELSYYAIEKLKQNIDMQEEI